MLGKVSLIHNEYTENVAVFANWVLGNDSSFGTLSD